jgi:hypothetical protein
MCSWISNVFFVCKAYQFRVRKINFLPNHFIHNSFILYCTEYC